VHITELEIDNFKSFARKTTIPFFEKSTVISGPNGSGKSNIIDAILFCLALSTSRGLRAEKLTDLLNLNTRKNTAEVSITFSEGTTIRRRIKRTPNGYYSYNYLNGRLVSQSDVIDHLSRVGIKPEGYNVVMQGDITKIMQMSDGERRKILDEIAGVAEFDAKKDQALQELEVVRERIDREEVLLHELDQRLADLAHERERALEYRKWQDELRHLQDCRSAAELREKDRELATLLEVIGGEEGKRSKAQDARTKEEEHSQALADELKGVDDQISQKSGPEYLALVSGMESEKGALSVASESITRWKKEKEGNLEEVNRIYLDAKRADAKVAECTDTIRNQSIDRANLALEFQKLQEAVTRMNVEITGRSSSAEGARDELFKLMEQVEAAKNARAEILRKKDALIERSRVRTSENERLSGGLSTIGSETAAKEQAAAACEQALAQATGRKEAMDRELAAIESGLFSLRASFENLQGEIKTHERELMRLEAQEQAGGEGGDRALRAILAMDGVYGTIGQLGRVAPEYATALSVAAGGKIRSIVVHDDEVAAKAIEFLKAQKMGRFTFLPLTRLKPPSQPVLEAEPGVIDYAVSLVQCDKQYAKAFALVFGTTVVVDTLAHARRLMGRYRMVTLEGELLERAGAITGGHLKKSKGFGIDAGEEITRLHQVLAALGEEAAGLTAQIQEKTGFSEKKRAERGAIDEETARARIQAEEYRRQASSLAQEEEQMRASLQVIDTEVKAGTSELADCEAELEKAAGEISRLNGETERLKKLLDDAELPGMVKVLEQKRTEAAELERRLRNKDSDINDAQREKVFFSSRVQELQAERERVLGKNREIDGQVQAAEARIVQASEKIAAIQGELATFSRDLEGLRAAREKVLEKVRGAEKKIGEKEAAIERIAFQITALQEREKAIAVEIAALREKSGGVTTDLTLQQIDEGIRSAEAGITGMGAINMLAVEEYDRISSRAQERKERKETLSRERASLIERIESYETMKFEAFTAAFQAIDANFREIFARLTRGTGNLILENEEDPFQGGLTFAVQPRDKKVHLLSALSGGEKSLTTLAFIFAIQKYLPAPFYAFDEVDMFLDGFNVEQIAAMIQEFASQAQFIIVSLRKPMIESADRILGVTLREDKSSLVTGVKAHG
jgi:chromosome segregation protein